MRLVLARSACFSIKTPRGERERERDNKCVFQVFPREEARGVFAPLRTREEKKRAEEVSS